jgi:hypothetical protein
MVNCVSFKEERCLTFSLFMGKEYKHCAKSLPTSKWEKNSRFVRESFLFKTRVSSNMGSMVNSVCSLKEYCVTLSVFLDQEHQLSAESPHSSEWEKHCSSCKRSFNIKGKRVLHFVKHG